MLLNVERGRGAGRANAREDLEQHIQPRKGALV
jgi:hypothetical protein